MNDAWMNNYWKLVGQCNWGMHILTNLSSVFMCAGWIVDDACVQLKPSHSCRWMNLVETDRNNGFLLQIIRTWQLVVVLFSGNNVYIVDLIGMKCIKLCFLNCRHCIMFDCTCCLQCNSLHTKFNNGGTETLIF
jgi:hypothetical protein